MELHEAIHQISDIRRQMARGSVFRGYRSLTVGFSGVLGILAATIQPFWVTSPQSNLERYLILWIGVAVVSLIVTGVELIWRAEAVRSGLTRETTLFAVEQFLPCLLVGSMLTFCISRSAPEAAWMLPGLWALVFGLGIFASSRLLPRQVFWVGAYYVLCGSGCLLAGDVWALSPWQMGITFGGGQLFGAAVLYRYLERTHVSSN